MKLYFASASANWRLVRDWINGARSDGHEVTMDWTQMVEELGRGNPEKTDPAVLCAAAAMDREGVRACETFILLWDAEVCGALLETGMALEMEKPVWIVSNAYVDQEVRYSIFWELPNVEQMDYDELRRRLHA